jgi:ligand-binding sensor domain-containing protein
MWNYGVSANDTSGWHHYAFGNGPMSNNVTAVAIDSSELKWFATQSSLREGMPGGVSVMDDQVQLPAWATYAYSDVLPLAYSYALATSANQVWVGTDEGAVLLDHQGNALDPAHAVCITYTLGGLLTCAPTHPITVGRDITVVQAVAIEPAASRVWFGTTRGLVYLDTGGTPFSRSDDHWCAFIGTDLITGTDVPTVTYAVTALVSSCIYDVALDDAGHVWLATARGLSVLDLQGTPLNPRDDQWQSFMSDVTIRSLARDRDGCWWLATPLGAVRFCDGGTPFVTMDDTWQIFTTADGLAGNDVYAIRVDAVTGHVWFGTDHGVSELVPASLLPTPTQTRMGTITVVPTLRASATPTLQASATPSVTATSPTVTLTGTPTSTFVQTVTPTGTRSVPETPSVTPTLGVTPMGHKLYLPSVSRAEGHLYLPLVRRGTPS